VSSAYIDMEKIPDPRWPRLRRDGSFRLEPVRSSTRNSRSRAGIIGIGRPNQLPDGADMKCVSNRIGVVGNVKHRFSVSEANSIRRSLPYTQPIADPSLMMKQWLRTSGRPAIRRTLAGSARRVWGGSIATSH